MHLLSVLAVLPLASLFFLFVLRFDFALVAFLLHELATLYAEKIKKLLFKTYFYYVIQHINKSIDQQAIKLTKNA